MSFKLIPLVIWSEIIDLLTNKDITNLLRTSKFFRSINIKNYSLKITDYSKINLVSNRYQQATKLEIIDINSNFNYDCKKLKELKVFNHNIKKYSIYYIYFFCLSSFDNLTSLSLTNVRGVNHYPKNLTYLKLDYCTGNFNNFPKSLKTLDFTCGYNQDEDENKNMIMFKFMRLPFNLEKLIINYTYISNYIDLPELNNNLKSLECSGFTLPNELPEKLEELVLNKSVLINRSKSDIFKNIKKLKIDNIFDYNFIISFEIKFSYLKKLEELDIGYNFIKNLKLPKSLRKLRIIINQNQVQLNFPNITSLILISQEKETYRDIKKYLEGSLTCENLINLELEGHFDDNFLINAPKLQNIKSDKCISNYPISNFGQKYEELSEKYYKTREFN